MHTLRRFVFLTMGVFQIFVLLAALAQPAHAYVDPGSGLLIFQIGGSMLAGALFVLRAKLRRLFRLSSKSAESTEGKTADISSKVV